VKFLESQQVVSTTTVGDVLDIINAEGLLEKYRDVQLGMDIDVGDVISKVADSETMKSFRNQSYTFNSTVGELVEMIGKDRVKDLLQNKIADASFNPDYEHTKPNVTQYWLTLGLFVLAFAALSTITLEFIDKDKR
jgi:hypothetical protein